jgi:cysteine desulfurase
MREDTFLVAAYHCNHDVGTIQGVARIGAIAKECGAAFFCDCSMNAGWISVNADRLGADMIGVAPHRFGGPLEGGGQTESVAKLASV